ncbi:hypothetical protein [Phormidium sp. CCY1219]|uniref:hypothetical protein n=1 Tax=Phormidium sp. CCY1219 TaxID=2886104 RepID=UPI002D1F9072|nr:hypothetical protein [Phormidium sp. CCY1219]MEB3829255.1 hypothetical protein [Phormidium sp. CCY1219]
MLLNPLQFIQEFFPKKCPTSLDKSANLIEDNKDGKHLTPKSRSQATPFFIKPLWQAHNRELGASRQSDSAERLPFITLGKINRLASFISSGQKSMTRG